MKNVLVLLHDDAGQEARLQVALDLARVLDGHLTCLDVAQMPASALEPLAPMTDQALFYEEEVRTEARNRRRIEHRLAGEDVRWTMVETKGPVADSILEVAGEADLIVLNGAVDEAELDLAAIARRVVLRSGKPIVAVGAAQRGINVHGNALVAWDGSRPAMAALTAAVPLLSHSRRVRIMEVGGRERESNAHEAAAYLSRHAVHASVHFAADEGGSIAGQLLDNVRAFAIDYCVMGAFGHSPLREAIFGGTTRKMLASVEVPLFLAR